MTYYCGTCDGRIVESGQANVFVCVRCGDFYLPAQLERARDVSQGKGTGMPYLSVPRGATTTGEEKMETYRISDDTESEHIEAATVEQAISDYVQGFGFNAPGEVECTVYDNEDCAIRKFLIRSDDGRRGKLIAVSAPDKYGNWWVQE